MVMVVYWISFSITKVVRLFVGLVKVTKARSKSKARKAFILPLSVKTGHTKTFGKFPSIKNWIPEFVLAKSIRK